MKQCAHAWGALRAFKLIDDLGKAPKLVGLLSWYFSDVCGSIGFILCSFRGVY